MGEMGKQAQGGSQCQILKGLVEEMLGLDRRTMVDSANAVKRVPKHVSELSRKHQVRSAAEGEGALENRGWRDMERRRGI